MWPNILLVVSISVSYRVFTVQLSSKLTFEPFFHPSQVRPACILDSSPQFGKKKLVVKFSLATAYCEVLRLDGHVSHAFQKRLNITLELSCTVYSEKLHFQAQCFIMFSASHSDSKMGKIKQQGKMSKIGLRPCVESCLIHITW